MPEFQCEYLSPDGLRMTCRLEYTMTGTSANWGGRVRLPNAKWHTLTGGQVVNIALDSIGPAVTQAAQEEVDGLDIKGLLKE